MASFAKLETIPEEFRVITPNSSLKGKSNHNMEQTDIECIQTIIYQLLLDGKISFGGVYTNLEENISTMNNCYAKCAVTLIDAYNLNYAELERFCKKRYSDSSLVRRSNNEDTNTISQIQRILDRLGFTFDLHAKPIISQKTQEALLNTVKLKCNELISDNIDIEKYTVLRDKIQRRQDQQKELKELNRQINANLSRMSRRGGKRKRRKTQKKQKLK
jgi:hypothetical protein